MRAKTKTKVKGLEGVGGAVLAGEVREDFLEEGHFSRDLREPHRYQGA